jgi:hypothetical protein
VDVALRNTADVPPGKKAGAERVEPICGEPSADSANTRRVEHMLNFVAIIEPDEL